MEEKLADIPFPAGQGPADGIGSAKSFIGREKYFEEMTADEKTDKIAEALEYAVREIRALRQEVNALRNHAHSPQGDMMVPVRHVVDSDVAPQSYFYRNPLGRERKRLA